MTLLQGNDWLTWAVTIIAAIGALNWGLREFFDFDLITDGLSFAADSTEFSAAIAVIAVAGALLLADVAQRVTE